MSEEYNEWAEPVSEVTISDLKNLCEELMQVRNKVDEHKKALKEVADKESELEFKILNIMKENSLPNFKGEFGSISVVNKKTITQPESMDNKLKLFSYLQEQGIFHDMVSVNSRTLNSWANKEIEAKEREGVFGWIPPGLTEPRDYQTLSVRKK